MMYKVCRLWIGFFTATLFGTAALAQQAPLTEKIINNYIDSLQKMEAVSTRLSAEDTDDGATMAQLWLEGDTAAIADYLRSKDYFPEIQKAVKEAGFANTEDWVNIAQRITQAFMALEIGEEGPAVATQMQESIQQIQNNEQLSAEQKDAIIQQLARSQEQLSQIENVSSADRDAVEPHMDRLREYFSEGAQ